jgi:FemAB-related protein (PEP-CTERM system-associated)
MVVDAWTPSVAAARTAESTSGASLVRVDDQPTAADWDHFIGQHPAASFYHRWGWRSVFEHAFGHQCVYLSAQASSAIVGVLPLVLFRSLLFGRFAVSLPFVNYGGVVADDEAVARALVARAKTVAERRRLSYVELRHIGARFSDLPAKRHKVAMWLTLPNDVATLWELLDRKVRNQIRKAEKSGLAVESGGSALIDDFYKVFARNMRDLGTPVYSRRLFERVLAEFPAESRLFVVRLRGEPVAGGGTITWRSVCENPWASSLREHRSLCPNMLLYWAMLKAAVEGGATRFDFGRSTPHEGTFYFKQQWGATPTPVAWEYLLLGGRKSLPGLSPANPKFRLMIEAWKRLPVPLATAVGPRIVRSIP